MIKNKLPFADIYPLGDSAVEVSFGDVISPAINARVHAFANHLNQFPFPGFIELIPAYATITVFYNPRLVSGERTQSPFNQVKAYIQEQLIHFKIDKDVTKNPVEIPVCYGGVFGPDLAYVARLNNLSPDEVVAVHAAGNYLVYMIGFAPGFAYLGGLNPKIATPRKVNPDAVIPAGSVGIAGNQTGIYPIPTPGGWQLIGRTPLILFNPNQEQPTLLKAGDMVRFIPVTRDEYEERKERQNEP